MCFGNHFHRCIAAAMSNSPVIVQETVRGNDKGSLLTHKTVVWPECVAAFLKGASDRCVSAMIDELIATYHPLELNDKRLEVGIDPDSQFS